MACSTTKITANFSRQCAKPLARGVEEVAYVGMKIDVTGTTYDETETNVVTAFTLASTMKLFKIEGFNLSNKSTVGFNATDFGNYLPHGFTFAVFNNSKRRGNGPFEMLGFNTGMRVVNHNHDSNDDANKGAYVLELSAPDETTFPLELQHETTGVADTAAYLETLASTTATI